METILKRNVKLAVNECLSVNELEFLGIYPKSINAYNYSFGILYKKGNQRIILQPMEDRMYKVVRMYTVYDYD